MPQKPTIKMMVETFEDPKTFEKVEGITILLEGTFKKGLDIIITQSDKYSNYPHILRDCIFRGLNITPRSNLKLMVDKFENPQTLEQIDGITFILEGEFKKELDFQIEKSPNYSQYPNLLNDSLFKGLKQIVDEGKENIVENTNERINIPRNDKPWWKFW